MNQSKPCQCCGEPTVNRMQVPICPEDIPRMVELLRRMAEKDGGLRMLEDVLIPAAEDWLARVKVGE